MLRDLRESPFAWQHRRALDIIAVAFDGQQRATALRLYLTITWMASEQRSDEFTAFVRTIAERSGLGYSTTKRYLSRFEELGLVVVERRLIRGLINDANTFLLVNPPRLASELPRLASELPRPATEPPPQPASEPGGPASGLHPYREELTEKEEQQQGDAELLLFIADVAQGLQDEGIAPKTALELAQRDPDLAADWLEAKREWAKARDPAGLLVAKIRAGEQPPRPRRLRRLR